MVSTVAGSGSMGFTNGMGTSAQFSGLTGLTVDRLNNVYAADNGNHAIRKIDSSVTFL